MNKHLENIQNCLKAMPFTEARRAIKRGEISNIGSSDHDFALSWLEGEEAELRDEREAENLAMSRDSRRSARIAIIIAIISIMISVVAIKPQITEFISWVVSKLQPPP